MCSSASSRDPGPYGTMGVSGCLEWMLISVNATGCIGLRASVGLVRACSRCGWITLAVLFLKDSKKLLPCRSGSLCSLSSGSGKWDIPKGGWTVFRRTGGP